MEESPKDLLKIINTLLQNSWLPPEWKLSKMVPVLKYERLVRVQDNIRPISLTGNFVKMIERIQHGRLMRFLENKLKLSPTQIGFRQGNSIWNAEVDIAIRVKKHRHLVGALVTLDTTKAYDGAEYNVKCRV